MESKSNKLLKNTMILSFGTLCTKGIMFLMAPLFTRWLTQSDYGSFDLFGSYVSLLIPIITFGACDAVFRFLADEDIDANNSQIRKILSIAVFEVGVGVLILAVGVLIICCACEKPRKLLPLFLILLFFEIIYTFISYVVRGLRKIPIYAISNIIFTLSMAVSSVVFVKVLNGGLGGIIVSYSIGYFVGATYSVCKVKIWKYISIRDLEITLLKDMLKYSLPLIPSALSWWVINVSDRTIISAILGYTTNAVYAVANKIPNLCQTLYNAFHLSWQENVVETFTDSDKDAYYSSVMNEMVQLIGSVAIVVLSINFLVFDVLFPQNYFIAYYQVPILMISLIFHMMAQYLGGIYIAQRNSKELGKTTLIAAITNLLVHVALVKFIGLYAATVSTLIAYVVLFIIRYRDIGKTIHIRIIKKTYYVIGGVIYMFTCVYINYNVLNVINVLLAVLFFCTMNKKILVKLVAILFRRRVM